MRRDNMIIKEDVIKMNKPPKKIVITFARVLLIFLILFLLFSIPTFVNFPLSFSSEELNKTIIWNGITHSVHTSLNSNTRTYLLRADGYIFNDNSESQQLSSEKIVDYFERGLNNLGWEKSEEYMPCRNYLPETNFLPENSPNGYIYFSRKNSQLSLNASMDFICLAVWQNTKDGNEYDIVILSVKPSLFQKIFTLLFTD
jgi:hypothetical protein